MKVTNIFLAVLTTSILASCSVFSLQPLYTENELVFDTHLLGTWTDQDDGIWQFEKTLQENKNPIQKFGVNEKTYTLIYKDTKDQKSARLFVHLMKLGNRLFLDLYPTDNYDKEVSSELLAAHLLPVHTFAKLDIHQDQVAIYPLNGEWLEDLFEQNKIRISHENVPYYGFSLRVLTASTEELQKFVVKYQNEQEAFEEPSMLKRKI